MQLKLNNFEGPLDLLLQLIEDEELDITKVSLLQVAEQYISYLENIEDKKPEMLADFLLIAAKLLFIKSKALLPELFDSQDEEDTWELEQQLKMYKRYYDASQVMEKILAQQAYAYPRPEQVKNVKVKFVPGKSFNSQKLKTIMQAIIKNLDDIIKLPKQSLAKVVSIKEKIKQIRDLLKNKEVIKFSELNSGLENRTEMIIAFLGLLELVKQRSVVIKQNGLFDEITIEANLRE